MHILILQDPELLSQSVSLNKLSVLSNGMVIHVIQDLLVENLILKNIIIMIIKMLGTMPFIFKMIGSSTLGFSILINT
jgi:hypothetical protein